MLPSSSEGPNLSETCGRKIFLPLSASLSDQRDKKCTAVSLTKIRKKSEKNIFYQKYSFRSQNSKKIIFKFFGLLVYVLRACKS